MTPQSKIAYDGRVIVNFLTSDVTGLAGSIGMTAAPGVNRGLVVVLLPQVSDCLRTLPDKHR